ncbi:uncharacterized protein METZ01_LOCUS427087, partial [marine metagenome]
TQSPGRSVAWVRVDTPLRRHPGLHARPIRSCWMTSVSD